MSLSVNKHTLKFIMYLALLSSMLSAYAQDKAQYDGKFQAGQYMGQAHFEYILSGQDTLFNGQFRLQRSSIEALMENEDTSFLFSGNFSNGKANGKWLFQFGEYQSANQSQVVDYQYHVIVNGTQEEASGLIINGKPHGRWTYVVNDIQESEVIETLFKSNFEFAHGVPQQSFRIENDSLTLVGRFLRNGMAHDEWSLYSSKDSGTSEDWFFEDGLLKEIELEENFQTSTIQVFGTTAKTKTILLNNTCLKVIELQLGAGDSINLKNNSVAFLLKENSNYYKKIDTVLKDLNSTDFLPDFKVKVPHFPIDSLQKRMLDTIGIRVERAKAISASFLKNPQLNILKLSDSEALFMYKTVSIITDRYLAPLVEINGYRQSGILEFISRSELVKNTWPNGISSKKIVIVDEEGSGNAERTFEPPNSNQFDFTKEGLDFIDELSKYVLLGLEAIEPKLNQKLNSQLRQQELISIEEKLVSENNRLERFIDSVETSLPTSYKKALRQIKKVTDERLNAFATTEELTAGRQLLECYTHMDSLARTVAVLPERKETVKEHYQDEIWNPFMATLMKEELKKRITGAYQKVLLPYFLNRVKNELSCDNVVEILDEINLTHERVLSLRDEDTAKIERKLKKEQDPKAVLRLFNVNTMNKED